MKTLFVVLTVDARTFSFNTGTKHSVFPEFIKKWLSVTFCLPSLFESPDCISDANSKIKFLDNIQLKELTQIKIYFTKCFHKYLNKYKSLHGSLKGKRHK